jgi:hypothetical protein
MSKEERVAVYATRDGGKVRITERQERALQASCAWQTLGYRFSHCGFEVPSYSAADILGMCSGYRFTTHIGLLHAQYRSVDAPFLVSNPERFGQSAACANFADAVKCAHELFHSDLVTVRADEFQPAFDSVADHWRVAILIVG